MKPLRHLPDVTTTDPIDFNRFSHIEVDPATGQQTMLTKDGKRYLCLVGFDAETLRRHGIEVRIAEKE